MQNLKFCSLFSLIKRECYHERQDLRLITSLAAFWSILVELNLVHLVIAGYQKTNIPTKMLAENCRHICLCVLCRRLCRVEERFWEEAHQTTEGVAYLVWLTSLHHHLLLCFQSAQHKLNVLYARAEIGFQCFACFVTDQSKCRRYIWTEQYPGKKLYAFCLESFSI